MDTHHVRWPEVSPRRYSISDCFSLPLDTHALGIVMCGPDVTAGFSMPLHDFISGKLALIASQRFLSVVLGPPFLSSLRVIM